MVKFINFLIFQLFFFIYNLYFVQEAFANENFSTFANTEYKIQESGDTFVTHAITIKNNKSDFFAKSYAFNLSNTEPQNVKAYEDGAELPVRIENSIGSVKISVDFIANVIGIANSRTFLITYDSPKLAKKSGEIWEISIPKITDPNSYEEYNVVLSVPTLFGEEAYISPEPLRIEPVEGRIDYSFDKNRLSKAGVTAGFGRFQVFNFSLSYHLENLDGEENLMEITLPPDTSTQRMFYQTISPQPQNVRSDNDGNWMAAFLLKPNEKLEIKTGGKVQIFASPRSLTNVEKPLETDLAQTQVWQSKDIKIQEIAASLDGPEQIYEYVRTNLSYNYQKVGQNYERKGALKALENPADSLCMEFTDLFIALARAKGIPAREINGFAYSSNPSVEPLSLVTDTLHAWPEYWDKEKMLWIPIDPTWANTTGGVDFFSKLDLRHFAFVIHSKDPSYPYSAGSYKPGTNPKKDVEVTFGNMPDIKEPKIDINYEYENGFSLFSRKIKVTIINNGPSAHYGPAFEVLFDGQTSLKVENNSLLPFGKFEKDFVIPYGFLGTKAPNTIIFSSSFAEVDIPPEKTKAILNQLLFISFIFLISLIYFFTKLRKAFFQKFLYAKK